ncbi:hypothetical protein GCM10028796_16960 [Ramlibacter monticola]|uniref:Uncharacterized protein n=1 Tax=Ramlibacter monticola TaxID=1926872 RepID=A0A936YX81_9BURK|nr:hypothetical protein [Ramlibacter monticola]MBL0390523.1 hypothetical protein [Ramlibacter monticola]
MPSNTSVFKSGGACTDTSLPILYRDPAASSGSKWVLDALDSYSWPSQAAPSVGNSWVNLVTGADGSFFAGTSGWGGAGGFTSAAATGPEIRLPTTGKVASGQLTGFVVIAWVKPSAVSSNKFIVGMTDGAAGTSQYLIYQSAASFAFIANTLSATTYNGVVSGTVYQVAVGYQGNGAGTFTRSAWVNGVQNGTGTAAAAASIYQPSSSLPRVGKLPAFSTDAYDGTIYRTLFDDLSGGQTVAQIVAADYAAGVGRFS